MNFILRDWVKYYTKEAVKTLKIVTIGSAMVLSVASIKYKPAYDVTISGESIGYITNRNVIEAKIEKYINETEGNIAFREIKDMPKFELKLISRDKKTDESDVMLAVKESTTTTYRTYAVTTDGEPKVSVKSREEAESIINEIKADLKKGVDLKLGVIEVYSTENDAVSKDAAKQTITEIKTAKVNEYETKKAEEAKKAAEAKRKALAASQARSIATAATSAPTGSLNGMALSIPVNGSVSSRFGSRGYSRSSVHTGVDIAASSGTGIRTISAGTVVYSAYKGSYGNLIIIDHGNGVQSYYAHCSALYVSAGQAVGAGTVIGAVGSTGNSTGPHLHLEIRVNGTPVNPQNYLY